MIQTITILFLGHLEPLCRKISLKNFVNIKGIFFDLDGTLFDTAPELIVAINAMLNDMSLGELEEESIKNFIGRGAENLIKKSIGLSSGKSPDVYFEEGDSLFKKHYIMNAAESKIYEGAEDTLKKLRSKGILLACVTNKPEIYTKALLKKSGLSSYLDLIVSGDTVTRMKPDPMPLQYGCDILKLKPSEVIMVGDSCNDINAGYAAGTFVVTVPYGYQYGESIISKKVDLAILNLLDLSPVVN